MSLPYLNPSAIKQFIQLALQEDIGDGDYSSMGAIESNTTHQAQLLIKSTGIIAGLELANHIFEYYDPSLSVDFYKKDGNEMKQGDIGFTVTGNAISILSLERLVLNCLQRMSGIATYTHRINEMIKKTKTKILDTRKTTPLFRIPEKWAFAIGGGVNHRFNLCDMIMIKNNHIDFAGGIANAINRTMEFIKLKKLSILIEIEVRNLFELEEVMKIGKIDRILLDNMSPKQIQQAVKLIDGKYETEVSGGINEHNILEYAQDGVDYISMGALTHSYSSLDMSFKAVTK